MAPSSPDLNATLTLGVKMGVEGMSTTVQGTILVRHASGGWTEQKSIPAGPQPDLVSVPIPAGVYSVEATLPSGLSLCLEGEIAPGETQSVLLAGEEAMPESLDWSSFALSGAVSILGKAKRSFKEKVMPRLEGVWQEQVMPKVTETISREGAKVYERYQLPIRERFSLMKGTASAWASSSALESLGTVPTMGHASSIELPEAVGNETSLEGLGGDFMPSIPAGTGFFMRFWQKKGDGNWEPVGANWPIELPAEQGVIQVPVPVHTLPITQGLMFLVEIGGFSSGISEFCMLPRHWSDRMEREVPVTLVIDALTENRQETSLPIRVRATVQDPDLAQLMSAMKTADHQVVDHVVAGLADEYLHEKVRNPLMAAAAALALLKMRQLELLRDWTYNLAAWFPELPDGPVIRAWHLLFGAPSKEAHDTARAWLLESERRGLPLFFESLRLLVDGLQLLKYPEESEEAVSPEPDEEVTRALRRCQSFLWAADADEDFNSYRGTHPNEPGITKRKIKESAVPRIQPQLSLMSNDTSTCLKTKGLDLKAAVFLAEASAEAYSRDPKTTKEWAAERGFTNCQPFDLGNIQGFWTEGDEVAMLSFRGTSNIGQWVRDARILPAGHEWGLVHRGFKKGVDIVHGYVDAFAAVAATKPYVWITGHSLGGALAVIAAANLKLKGINASTYTYGQPRAGYINFADNFDRKLSGRLYRFINQMDIVARLPPGLLFKHCGIPKRIVRPGVLESVEVMLNAELPVEAYEMPDLLYQPERRPVLLERLEEAEMLGRPQMIDSDLPALTEREFLQLQLQLGVASEGYEEGIEFEGSVHSQGLFGDHAIVNYINLLREIRDQA